MKTTGTKIIVVPTAEQVERTPGGIIIPKSSNLRKPNRGTVISVGPGVQSIAEGDVVTYLAGSGVEIEDDRPVVEEQQEAMARVAFGGKAPERKLLVMQEQEVLTIR